MLLIRLEDAVQIAVRIMQEDFAVDLDEDDVEYVEQELREKCYRGNGLRPEHHLQGLIWDINPKEICAQIEADNLSHWCKIVQTEMFADMVRLGWKNAAD